MTQHVLKRTRQGLLRDPGQLVRLHPLVDHYFDQRRERAEGEDGVLARGELAVLTPQDPLDFFDTLAVALEFQEVTKVGGRAVWPAKGGEAWARELAAGLTQGGFQALAGGRLIRRYRDPALPAAVTPYQPTSSTCSRRGAGGARPRTTSRRWRGSWGSACCCSTWTGATGAWRGSRATRSPRRTRRRWTASW